MNQILSVWDALEPRKRVIACVSAVAVFLAILGLAKTVNAPTLDLLYAGLDPSASGEIVAALEGQGVAYEVRGNAIYVDKSARDRVRMSLASEGLPANGIAGYELLDGLSGFGTTSQMFDAAYWRAKEGELARTILSSPQVRSARVHISNTVRRPFDSSSSATASAIVTMNSGDLSIKQAKAMRYLIASAVAGMPPEQVSIIDAVAGIVLAAGTDPEISATDDTAARAATMRANIERLLAARVGAGKAIVEVNIDADMNSETITERVLDPESRVTMSSDVEEKSSSANGTGGGAVTVASNLPDGDVQGGGESSQSTDSEIRERMNFDVSEVRRERVKLPGEIRRITVAVLVDGVMTTNADGTETWQERSAEEMNSLTGLVQSAIGFDAARGDVVTMSSMQFSEPQEVGTLAEAGSFDFLAVNAISLVQMLFFGLVALGLGMFVLKPILTSSASAALPAQAETAALGAPAAVAQTGEISEAPNTEIEINPEVLEVTNPDQLKIAQLRETISARADESAAVLEDWLQKTDKEPEGVA